MNLYAIQKAVRAKKAVIPISLIGAPQAKRLTHWAGCDFFGAEIGINLLAAFGACFNAH